MSLFLCDVDIDSSGNGTEDDKFDLYYLIRLCQVIVLDRRLCSLYLHVRQDSGPVLSKHEQ